MANWHEDARAMRWKIQPFIDGRYRPSASHVYFDTVNPATETTLCRVAAGDLLDVNEAVDAARRSFEDGRWSQMPPGRRATVLMKLADLIVRDKSELALLDTLEVGKPIVAAISDAEEFAAPLLRNWAGFADKLLGQSAPIVAGNLQLNFYEPRGVVGAITPWNFPIVNAIFKVGPALAAGNSIVVKPSELSASSALRVAELALEAGVPEGVLNIVPGLGSTVGSALAQHSDVNLLTFTGSTLTGRKIMELAGRSNGKPVMLELGGKSPQVVFDDAEDLDAIARAVVHSFLRNSGQVCSAHTRVIASKVVAAKLLEKVVDLARTRVPGDPLDESTTLGPLASPAQRDRVKSYIQQGLAEGARLVLKGDVQEAGGCFVSPAVFDGVQPHMTIAREEIFGPVLCVQEFETEEQAIALANGTDYGLGATVWTRDMGRGRRMARAIKAGHVSIRTSGAESLGPACPLSHEPQKASGFGSEFGIRGLQSYSTLKSVTFIGN